MLLPSHYAGDVVDGFDLVDATTLGRGQQLVVLQSTSGGELFAAPVVVEQQPSGASGSSGSGGSGGSVRRAVPGDGAARALLVSLAHHGRDRDHEQGEGFAFAHLHDEPVGRSESGGGAGAERPMLVDQTHESVVVDDRFVVKWAVRAEPTPAPALVAHLSETGFDRMAQPSGFVSWRHGEQDVLVASAVSYLPGAADGWTWAVEAAGAYAIGTCDLETATAPLAVVGDLVADLHASLATPSSVLPDPYGVAGREDLTHWRELAEQLLDEAVSEVDGAEGERLRTLERRVREVFAELQSIDSTPVIPVHGDLHVGQILRWDGGYAVGDFDGNPVLPVAERLVPQPAARDVAGMLQAVDHVGRVVDRRVEGADPQATALWIVEGQRRFLDAYETGLGARGRSGLLDRRLLLSFRVEQECREFLYAVRHLPRWRYVPDQALRALLSAD